MSKTYLLSDNANKTLIAICEILLPLIGLILMISTFIWDIPGIRGILAIIFFFIMVIGIILNLDDRRYAKTFDGEVIISTDVTGKKTFVLELDTDPNELADQDHISFKVISEDDVVS